MTIELVFGDKRSTHYKSWSKWMKEVQKLRSIWAETWDDDPVCYNEIASMSALGMAAIKLDWLSLVEFTTIKRSKDDGRKRVNGRADLWIYDPTSDVSWSIEAKQGFLTSHKLNVAQKNRIHGAWNDAKKIDKDASNHRIALVVTVDRSEARNISVEKVTHDQLRDPGYCWKLTNAGSNGDWTEVVYFTFYFIDNPPTTNP